MQLNPNVHNKFDPRNTKTVIIHDGKFHADDMLFAAMAIVAAERHRNKIEVIRTGEIPPEHDSSIIVGDIGLGIYDHHNDRDGNLALGIKNSEKECVSACGLLYREIHNVLFQGESETKKVFEAFIDIVEHCDNTPDNNTFSDSINYMAPADESKTDEQAIKVIEYCKHVVAGFIDAHEKEKSGKIWAVPRVCSGIVPGIAEKRDSRYWKASNQIKSRYRYISFNNTMSIKLRAMDTYSLACGVLNQRRRQYWREFIEMNDAQQIAEMERREKEEWPNALQNMQHRTIVLDNYFPYGKYAKDVQALFVVLPSQRGGYTVNILKTNNGNYRFDPDLLTNFEGCSFVVNDKRFLFFDTKEHAVEAAYMAGQTMDKYLQQKGFEGYLEVYGGIKGSEPTGDHYQEVIGHDIAFNLYVKDIVKNPNKLTIEEYRKLQCAALGNEKLIHSFCTHFVAGEEDMSWDFNSSVVDNLGGEKKEILLSRNRAGRKWSTGLNNFLNSTTGQLTWYRVHPTIQTIPNFD